MENGFYEFKDPTACMNLDKSGYLQVLLLLIFEVLGVRASLWY